VHFRHDDCMNDCLNSRAAREMSMDGWAAVKLATTGNPKVWVFAIEADFQWTGQDGSVSACLDELSVCGKASYDLDWFGTVRGRAGYLVSTDTLLYFTGGLAHGRVNADFSLHPALGTTSVSDRATKTGLVVFLSVANFDYAWGYRVKVSMTSNPYAAISVAKGQSTMSPESRTLWPR
jgi:opacity protein-like surface antigen